MQKTVLFAFRDDPMCFIHVLLTALDMQARGFEAGIVLEGEATRFVTILGAAQHPMHTLYMKVRGEGLFYGACRACSLKMGMLEQVKAAGLPLLDDMNGHPGMAGYMERGYTVLTF
ncbi:MAG: cytoplasmic protein [Proteobacteria bacterium]|nr:cytoplasmic protein [Pseudomonadota bacterium]MBU1596187.1 cytoplasmic protein [Pseudomonadota bacterium]